MADSTSIPIIVQGNSFSLAIPLQMYVVDDDEMVLDDYTPDPTDKISVQLKGSRRNYTYTPTSVDDNIVYIDLSGNELADNYAVVVSIVKNDGKRLRSFRTDQFFIVESSDDLTPDDIIEGLEENVIYLNTQCFVAGADGRGITSITKTATAGLVDTYTILYTDNTTSTFTVTNGAAGEAGSSIATIEKTGTVGLVDTYTITLTNGDTSTFEVTNGMDGVDLGLANIVDDLITGGSTNVLSAEQGLIIKSVIEQIFNALGEYAFPDGKPTLDWTLSNVGVTLTLSNVTSSNTAATTARGEAYTTTLTGAQSGDFYVMDVVVTMGGTDVTSTAYNSSTGVVSIANVTGAIEITASQITYIADGLILQLDGLHQGGVSGQWIDLIGNKVFNISSATAQANGVLFSKTNSTYGTNQDNLVPNDSHLTYTIESAFMVLNSATWGGSFQLLSTKAGIMLGYDASYGYLTARTTGTASSSYTPVKYSDRKIFVSVNNTRGFGNSVALTKSGTAKYSTAAQNVLGNLNGTMYALRIYSRTLTEAEILNNQKVDNLRFNS